MSVTASHTTITAALTDLLLTPGLDLDTAVDRHFTPDYRQRTDGSWADRAAFVDHIRHLRGVVASGTLEVHEEFHAGNLTADRHTVDVVKTDGTQVRMEVYLFGEYGPCGRFRRIEETTLLLDGPEAERDLGSAR
ncbi:nuclear transport factor 2 family protein [Kitasatospora sp. NPDC002965]|uniref:nuclear transport factor 2 family protein n=1 Tax=Kitasatospora sp. NPDC002965 TaxID=3154775 RepID=UPI0033BA2A3F